MQLMSIQPYRMTEQPDKMSGATVPSFTSKTKFATDVAKKGIENGAAILTAGAAALTGQVLVNKSKRPTVKEISSECFDIQEKSYHLPELTMDELKELDSLCDKTADKCNKYLKKQSSPTVEYCLGELAGTSHDVKKQIVSNILADVEDLYDVITPDDERIVYYDLPQEELDKLHNRVTSLLEECDKYSKVSYELGDERERLQNEKDAIEIVPKLKDMSFEEIYDLHDGTNSALDRTVDQYMNDNYLYEYMEKFEEIRKMCSSYERGLMNYNKATGNVKDLIKEEMANRYGYRFFDDIEESTLY